MEVDGVGGQTCSGDDGAGKQVKSQPAGCCRRRGGWREEMEEEKQRTRGWAADAVAAESRRWPNVIDLECKQGSRLGKSGNGIDKWAGGSGKRERRGRE